MERTRLVLIFSALCLALVFSVSSVEAQKDCNEDDDAYVKDTNKCRKLIGGDILGTETDGEDTNCAVPDLDACGDPDPEPDPEPNKGTPVKVTFDDFVTDSIRSDGDFYAHEESKTGVLAILDGGVFMNMRAGGVRKLFVNFGPAVDCDDTNGVPDSDGDCVLDSRFNPGSLEGIVECPFPQDFNVRGTQDNLNDDVCSAFVKAALWEHDAFEGDPPEVLAHIEDMHPGVPCFPPDPDPLCGGTVMKVRPFQDRDIEFVVPSPKGKKFNGWSIIFSDKQGHCSGQNVPPPYDFPDFLSIRALDVVPGVGGALGADTWKIGTFKLKDEEDPGAGAEDDPRLACLVKHKGDEFVGFFSMSFMYTVVILEPAP